MSDEPITFWCTDAVRWADVLAGARPAPAEYGPRQRSNEDNWVVGTFLQLARRGRVVRLDTAIPRSGIVVCDGIHLGAWRPPASAFLVICRSDAHRPGLAHHTVVQNGGMVLDAATTFVPHWPQPGLRPRDPGRGEALRRVAFFGDASENLAAGFNTPAFAEALRARGLEWCVVGKDRSHEWGDYREVDLVLAVRPAVPAFTALKPASKLVNAWLAGVPALLGPEPAFRDLRQGDDDYLEVETPEQALAAIDRLRTEAGLYRRLVENGTRRAAAFSEDAVAARWWSLLESLRPAEAAWRARPGWWKAAHYLGRTVRHRWWKVQHRRLRRRFLAHDR